MQPPESDHSPHYLRAISQDTVENIKVCGAWLRAVPWPAKSAPQALCKHHYGGPEVFFKPSHARLKTFDIVVADAACIQIQELPDSLLHFPQNNRAQEEARQCQKERIERMKDALNPEIEMAFHAKRTVNHHRLYRYLKKDPGSLLKTIQDRVGPIHEASREDVKQLTELLHPPGSASYGRRSLLLP